MSSPIRTALYRPRRRSFLVCCVGNRSVHSSFNCCKLVVMLPCYHYTTNHFSCRYLRLLSTCVLPDNVVLENEFTKEKQLVWSSKVENIAKLREMSTSYPLHLLTYLLSHSVGKTTFVLFKCREIEKVTSTVWAKRLFCILICNLISIFRLSKTIEFCLQRQ